MTVIIMGLIIGIVLMALLWWGDEYAEARIGFGFLLVVLGVIFGTLMTKNNIPTIEDYIHGKVRIKVQQTYENGGVVKCDTTYYKL